MGRDKNNDDRAIYLNANYNGEWVSIKDMLPNDDDRWYLFGRIKFGVIEPCMEYNNTLVDHTSEEVIRCLMVTHWMKS